jgi:hypothetical protein
MVGEHGEGLLVTVEIIMSYGSTQKTPGIF